MDTKKGPARQPAPTNTDTPAMRLDGGSVTQRTDTGRRFVRVRVDSGRGWARYEWVAS
jgi:hypothetical protein